MNSIDSVSDGSNLIHLNSVNNSVQAVYTTVLPASLMVFFVLCGLAHILYILEGNGKQLLLDSNKPYS